MSVSLCNLCVLRVSVVNHSQQKTHHRGYTEKSGLRYFLCELEDRRNRSRHCHKQVLWLAPQENANVSFYNPVRSNRRRELAVYTVIKKDRSDVHIAEAGTGEVVSLEKLLPVIRNSGWFCGAHAVGVLHIRRS